MPLTLRGQWSGLTAVNPPCQNETCRKHFLSKDGFVLRRRNLPVHSTRQSPFSACDHLAFDGEVEDSSPAKSNVTFLLTYVIYGAHCPNVDSNLTFVIAGQ